MPPEEGVHTHVARHHYVSARSSATRKCTRRTCERHLTQEHRSSALHIVSPFSIDFAQTSRLAAMQQNVKSLKGGRGQCSRASEPSTPLKVRRHGSSCGASDLAHRLVTQPLALVAADLTSLTAMSTASGFPKAIPTSARRACASGTEIGTWGCRPTSKVSINRPPGLRTRINSLNTAARAGTCSRTDTLYTASKYPSEYGSVRPSPIINATGAMPSRAANRRRRRSSVS